MKIKVQITPNASKNEKVGWMNDSLKVKITAPPHKGKANIELIKFLAEEWNISRDAIRIHKGFTQRTKLLEINATHKIKLPQREQLYFK